MFELLYNKFGNEVLLQYDFLLWPLLAAFPTVPAVGTFRHRISTDKKTTYLEKLLVHQLEGWTRYASTDRVQKWSHICIYMDSHSSVSPLDSLASTGSFCHMFSLEWTWKRANNRIDENFYEWTRFISLEHQLIANGSMLGVHRLVDRIRNGFLGVHLSETHTIDASDDSKKLAFTTNVMLV